MKLFCLKTNYFNDAIITYYVKQFRFLPNVPETSDPHSPSAAAKGEARSSVRTVARKLAPVASTRGAHAMEAPP